MTRSSQKEAERRIVEHYLSIRGLIGELSEGHEPPDFVLRSDATIIGLEVLEYHDPALTTNGHTRRVVEASWEKLRGAVQDFRTRHHELENLGVYLDFNSLRVPSPAKTDTFLNAVLAVIRQERPSLGNDFRSIDISDAGAPLLTEYLKRIRLEEVGCYMEWDWNHDTGGIGTSDDVMVIVLGPKLTSYIQPPDVTTSHLIVAGWGSRMSSVIAPLGAWQFNRFTKLNQALEDGPFDEIAILCFKHLIWQRTFGWSELPQT